MIHETIHERFVTDELGVLVRYFIDNNRSKTCPLTSSISNSLNRYSADCPLT